MAGDGWPGQRANGWWIFRAGSPIVRTMSQGINETSDKSESDKSLKKEARALWEQSREAFNQGDYRLARRLDNRVKELGPGSEHGRQAARELEGLRIDRGVLYAGVGALTLYILAWWVGLSG